MGFGVWGLGFGVWGLVFWVWSLGFGVWGLGFGVFGLAFGVFGLGLRVLGVGVWSLEFWFRVWVWGTLHPKSYNTHPNRHVEPYRRSEPPKTLSLRS